MKQYIVDAFTSKPFSGNPAAVCVMENWPSGEFMMKLAMENNLSETAFIVKEAAGYHLRWFTPATEVELCGHATLASSFVILNFYEPDSETVFASIVPEYLGGVLYGALCESRAAEQAARRTAMDSATQNAEEMIADLSLQFNRARQAAITQEITEIVAGS